jgi:ABC-type maltose transport system permease subunit
LFSLAILVALFGILTTEAPLINKAPLFVMVFVYSIAVYHFGISKSYQAFFEYQNEEINHSKYEK